MLLVSIVAGAATVLGCGYCGMTGEGALSTATLTDRLQGVLEPVLIGGSAVAAALPCINAGLVNSHLHTRINRRHRTAVRAGQVPQM